MVLGFEVSGLLVSVCRSDVAWFSVLVTEGFGSRNQAVNAARSLCRLPDQGRTRRRAAFVLPSSVTGRIICEMSVIFGLRDIELRAVLSPEMIICSMVCVSMKS